MDPEKIERIELVEEIKDEGEACACACGGSMCGAQAIELVSLSALPTKALPAKP